MTLVDRLLQRLRIRAARSHIPPGSRVLDIGCGDGALFRLLSDRISSGIGVEPELPKPTSFDGFNLIPGVFPDAVPSGESFDVITMLAVIEHVPDAQLSRWGDECLALLREGGSVIVTVPAPAADRVLMPLRRLRVIDGMALDSHHGFSPSAVPQIFGKGFELVYSKRFELGFNNLFVYRKAGRSAGA